MASLTSSPAEFTLYRKFKSNRRSPLLWILSYIGRQWWLVIIMTIGAIGNAALAAYVPVLTGDAFNAMLQTPPNVKVLLPLALIMGGSQIIRAILQLGRNFGRPQNSAADISIRSEAVLD